MGSVNYLGRADYILLASMANEELALFDKPLKLGDLFQARLKKNVDSCKSSLEKDKLECQFISFGLLFDEGLVIEKVTDLALVGNSACDKIKLMDDVVSNELFVGRIALNEFFAEKKLALCMSESRRFTQDKAAVARAVRMLNNLGASLSEEATKQLTNNKCKMGVKERENFALRSDLEGHSGMSYLLMMLGINE